MNDSPQRVRVLHLIPSFHVAGAEQMAAHLMTGLLASHDVAAVGLYPALNSVIEQQLIDAGIPVSHLDKHLGFDPSMFSAIDRVIKATRPDVVHTHMSVLRYALPGLLRRRVPVVVHTLHTLAERDTDAFGRAVHWFAFRKPVLPVAVSREVAASVRRVYGLEYPAVVPNCIPVAKYQRNLADGFRWRDQEGFDRDAILFTSVARLEPPKNPLLLVRSFAAISDPRAHLVLLGQGSLFQELDTYIRQRGLGKRVHLLGTRHDIPECLAASDVFALSSNWEGTPLSVMEAMAAGLPVISTAAGGVPELVESGRHGILVAPGDEAALAEAMLTLLNNPERRMLFGNAARARAGEAFDVARMVQGYASIYQNELASAKRSVALAVA